MKPMPTETGFLSGPVGLDCRAVTVPELIEFKRGNWQSLLNSEAAASGAFKKSPEPE